MYLDQIIDSHIGIKNIEFKWNGNKIDFSIGL